ncbi:MAG: hypothetical protein RQM92_01525 [Candidatus Syntrophopropionicum ammoniitolerans]
MNTEERILKMKELRATAFMATPTYVLGMADTARKMGIDPRDLGITKILCAGEPGASVPTTKKRMEDAWGCNVYDHIGATEMEPGDMSVLVNRAACTLMKPFSWQNFSIWTLEHPLMRTQ